MRRTTTAIATAMLAIGLAACGPTDTVNTSPDKPASKASSPAAKQTAAVGDSITLTGQDHQLTVTLTKWSTSVSSTDGVTGPEPGKTWVAGQFEIKNTGSSAYSDNPNNCVQVADASGQRFPATIVTGINVDQRSAPVMTADMKLAPGDKALGWITFEVPAGTKIATVQFTPNSGMADQTGQWAFK